MKLLHTSDLHLGKQVNKFSMQEDQEYILDQICAIAERERPDAVLIAGDVYDRTVPPAESVALFDRFLCRLAELKLPVFIISGNHDSPERIAFGGRLMDASGIHMSPVYAGQVEPIVLEDDLGPVNIYMLPFVKPAHVRRYFPEEVIGSWTEALGLAAGAMKPDPAGRNVLLAHQFVTGAVRSESEEIAVGGADNVDAAVFGAFDYVALGHIHRRQDIHFSGGCRLHYSGAPLKYDGSEAEQEKSVTLAELREKGEVSLTYIPLIPLRDLRKIRGSYLELSARVFYEKQNREDYLYVTLTDEEDVPDALEKLRLIYPNLMRLEYDNRRTRSQGVLDMPGAEEQADPLTLFGTFYEQQNNQPMSEEQAGLMKDLIETIWEDRQ